MTPLEISTLHALFRTPGLEYQYLISQMPLTYTNREQGILNVKSACNTVKRMIDLDLIIMDIGTQKLHLTDAGIEARESLL